MALQIVVSLSTDFVTKSQLASCSRIWARVSKSDLAAICPRFKERPGGYLRILKTGPRPGDAAPMAIIQLVDGPVEADTAET